MENINVIEGLPNLWSKTHGHSEIRIAILDGQVNTAHACFEGAKMIQDRKMTSQKVDVSAPMVKHGTHVSSIIMGQHHTNIKGIAPKCTGLLIPVFSDNNKKLSQLDLARAIEHAVESGAHIINISGGQLSESGGAETWLKNAIAHCTRNNVLVIAAAGNNGCDCLHVPASIPNVLAVGAMDEKEKPLGFSNWGKAYAKQGLLAPGKDILGANSSGGISRQSGTSVAAPIVTGVAALLLSMQIERGEKPNPEAIRHILLNSVTPCEESKNDNCQLYLAGKLNINQALNQLNQKIMSNNTEPTVEASACECDKKTSNTKDSKPLEEENLVSASTNEAITNETESVVASHTEATQTTKPKVTESIEPSSTDNTTTNRVFVLGTLGYDFGSEARRDAFKQLMAPEEVGGVLVPSNPYDARQMVKHFESNLSETKSVIWTLNLELTPIYAIEAEGAFARDVYESLLKILTGQIKQENDKDYIERVCIPGVLTGKKVTLFSGQVVPVISLTNSRGIYGWRVNDLIDSSVAALKNHAESTGVNTANSFDENLKKGLQDFLEKIYYNLRNLGTTSRDRALNYAGTNAFQATHTFSDSAIRGYELDDIQVEKSPFGRMDSDCWDVLLKFFNPKNNQESKRVYRFTVDVSDTIPVSVGKVRSWSSSN